MTEKSAHLPKKRSAKRLRWFVVRTQSRKEVQASVHIASLGVTVFVPLHYEMVKDGKWWKPEARGPLFPRYIFIACRANSPWGAIRDARGVEHVMCRPDGSPIAVPYREMRLLRTRHKRGDRKRREPKFSKGQLVKIGKGPFEGFEAVIESASAKDRVTALVSLFGRATSVEFAEEDLRAA